MLVLPQEAFADQLMRADDELQPVDMVEVFTDVLQDTSTEWPSDVAAAKSVSSQHNTGHRLAAYGRQPSDPGMWWADSPTNNQAPYSVTYLAVSVACTAGANAPPHAVIRITPQQVTHWAFMRDLLKPVQLVNLVQCVHGWRQSCRNKRTQIVNHTGFPHK